MIPRILAYLNILPQSDGKNLDQDAPSWTKNAHLVDTKYGPTSIRIVAPDIELFFHWGIPGGETPVRSITVPFSFLRSTLEPILSKHDHGFEGKNGPIFGTLDTSHEDFGEKKATPLPVLWLSRPLQDTDLTPFNTWLSDLYTKPCRLTRRIHFAIPDEGRCDEGYVVEFDS